MALTALKIRYLFVFSQERGREEGTFFYWFCSGFQKLEILNCLQMWKVVVFTALLVHISMRKT